MFTVGKLRKRRNKCQIVSRSGKEQDPMQEIKQFRTHLERLGYGKSSVQMLPSCVAEFLKYTSKPIHQVESKDITRYHDYLHERPNRRRAGGLSESFIHHHVYSLRLFFSWQMESGQLTGNPISSLEFPSPGSQPREILTIEEIKELYQVTTMLKERAVLSLFYGCGLRRSEGEKLNMKDIQFRSNLLHVREGKGNKRRVVPMSGQVKSDLLNYALKERFAMDSEQACICNRAGRRATGDSLNRIVKSILARTGIEKSLTLHGLRHSIATHLLESGLAVEHVRDFLGHKHLESTQIYTRIKSKQLWVVSHRGQ